MTEPIVRRDQFHCRKCFKHWPMNMLAYRQRGHGVCADCAEKIRRCKGEK